MITILVEIKKIKNSTINIYDDCIPKDISEYRKNLKNVYDTINNIFSDKKYDNLFYSEEELKKLEKKNKKIFI